MTWVLSRRKHAGVGLTFLSFILATLFSANLFAAPVPQDITLSPTSAAIQVYPGKTKGGTFRIINQGQTTYTFKVYATPYSVTDEAYTPDFSNSLQLGDITKWFIISPTQATVEPGESKTIRYSITPPVTTPPGGYYAAVFAEAKRPASGSSVVVTQRVGELFYLQIGGNAIENGSVKAWDVPWFQLPPLMATLELKNSGTVHYFAPHTITIKDIFGNKKYEYSSVKAVLPSTARKIPLTWADTPLLGLFVVSGSVQIYNKVETLPDKIVFVIAPIVLILLAVLLCIITAALLYRKHRRESRRRRAEKDKD